MEYNTLRKKLILPEYGRHIHKMVQHIVDIEDRNQRNAAAHDIIAVMGTLKPSLRESPDFKHKLWNHLFVMSEFQLDIDAPYPIITPNELKEKPQLLPYPQSHIRQKHYGKILIEMIRQAGKLQESDEKDQLIRSLLLQMKRSYTMWSRSEISVEQIVQDIWDISNGKIKLDPATVKFPEQIIGQFAPSQVDAQKKKNRKKPKPEMWKARR